MTKKDYELIANVMSKQISSYPNDIDVDIRNALRITAYELAYTFAGDNPRFDSDRFISACGF